MDYIVFDLEWNQGSEKEKDKEKELPFEIIEIGAVKLNHRMEIMDRFSQLIRPQVYRQLNYVTRRLIHLKMEQLQEGRPFLEVAADFLQWCGEDYIFCTWGPLDLTELQRNMRYYGMEPLSDRPIRFFDVQKLFGIAYEDPKSRRSLEHAVDYLQLEKDIPFHRAFGDAYYTARVLQNIKSPEVLGRYSFDTFITPKSRKKEIHAVFDDYAKYISREFADKAELLADREVISTRCYLCHHNMKRKIRWFSPNGRHYYSVSYCYRHGYVKGKIRIRKTQEKTVFAVKTMKRVDQEEVERIRQKKGRSRQAEKEKKQKQITKKISPK